MASKKEKFKKCVWYAVFIALLVITITQLMQSFDSWEERPFDTIVDKVPKQNIPYPSVTVCPAGSTIWSGVRQFLNEMEFKDEYKDMLKQSYNTLLRLKIANLRLKPGELDPFIYTYQECYDWTEYLKNREFCNFAMYVLEMTSRMISEDIFTNRTLAKYQKNRLNVRFEEIEGPGCFGPGFACNLNLNSVVKQPAYSRLPSYLDLLTVEMVESGITENPFDIVLQEMYLPPPITTPEPVTEITECVYCLFKREISSTLDNPSWEDVRKLNSTFSLPPPKNIMKYVISTCCSPWITLSQMYHEYSMLSKLQFQNFKNLGDFIVTMAKQALYDESISNYLTQGLIENTEKELQDFLRFILQEITEEKELSWSLIDAIDILVILGGNEVIGNRISAYRNTSGGRQDSWQSLTKTEKHCVSDEYEKLFNNLPEFEDPCIDPSSMCEEFCKNMALMQKHAKDEKIQKLLRYVSHPAKYSKNSTWTVPFCFTGNEQEKFTQLIKKPNVNTGSNETNYGYKFCESVEQRFTDVGLCTTFHDTNVTYPPKGISKPFQKGITMILDSFAYFTITREMRTFRDYFKESELSLISPETLTDNSYNDFYVFLHSKDDIPLFQGPEDKRISLRNGKETIANYLKEYRIPFTVKITETEKILEKYSITQQMVRKMCNCLPWYLDLKNQTEPVCNLFGNKCYEQSTIQANQHLDFSNPNNPPCDCFPDCEGVSYNPSSETRTPTALENRNILDLELQLRKRVWDDDAMVIEFNKKKFLFDYVADMLKEEGGKIFYRSNLTSDIDNMVDKRLCTESLINCLIWQRAVNLASVWLDFEDNYFVKEHLIERVPIGDKISSIGGTLGLFLGFSFLSIVDLVYWVIKTVEVRMRRRKRK